MNDESGAFAPPLSATGQACADESGARPPAIPAYLAETYWWAYLHPRAVRLFEREWLVNLILWGNMRRLTAAVLDDLPTLAGDSVLQLACVYGRFTERLASRLAKRNSRLHLVDIAPIQLDNARRKLSGFGGVRYHHMDSSALRFPAGRFGTTVLFFLLHEQPEAVRRKTLAEALRVTRPGGRIIVVDYHGPGRLNPWRYLMWPVLRWLEPFALDLWRHPIVDYLPGQGRECRTETRRYFGGLYQKTVITRSG